jgi:hypothetical protein
MKARGQVMKYPDKPFDESSSPHAKVERFARSNRSFRLQNQPSWYGTEEITSVTISTVVLAALAYSGVVR